MCVNLRALLHTDGGVFDLFLEFGGLLAKQGFELGKTVPSRR